MPGRTWEIIDEKDYKARKKEALKKHPDQGVEVKNINEKANDIYTTSRKSTIIDSGGVKHTLNKDEKIKVLDEDKYPGVTWLYYVEEVWVRFAGKTEASLREGTAIAVLPPDWKEELKARRQQDEQDGGGNN